MPDVSFIRRDETPITLYNPLDKDFSCEWRDDTNKVHVITIPSLETKTFPAYKAEHVKRNLIDAVCDKRFSKYITEERRKEAEKEILTNE